MLSLNISINLLPHKFEDKTKQAEISRITVGDPGAPLRVLTSTPENRALDLTEDVKSIDLIFKYCYTA